MKTESCRELKENDMRHTMVLDLRHFHSKSYEYVDFWISCGDSCCLETALTQ